MTIDEQIDFLTKNATLETNREEFKEKLDRGKPLRVKYGIDPTSPHVHFGHTVPLRILKRFQEQGHEAHLIIGDFTARIGDPSGRNEGRPKLSQQQIKENKETYLSQISKFVDLTKAKVWHNSTWLWRLHLSDMIEECSHITVQRLLDRNDFSSRIKSHIPIGTQELFYPICQAIDSRHIEADVEIGGTEQLYTLMLARDVQERAHQSPQSCITVPILRGTDGKRRMGKSLDNFVAIDDTPQDIYGKTMSIPDELMPEWEELLTEGGIKTDRDDNPMARKMDLAYNLVRDVYGIHVAWETAAEWVSRFSVKRDPTVIPEVSIPKTDHMNVCGLLVATGLSKSLSEARRAIVPTSGVRIGPDHAKITDPNAIISLENDLIVRIGKRKIVKLVLTD